MHRTKVDEALEALEEKFADDSERVTLLRCTRRFKTSWLELGALLTDVKRSRAFERWGYAMFEAYTSEELKLRPETVEKLTGSYVFLRGRAPEVLERDPLEGRIPSYQAIDFLRRAEERAEKKGGVPDEAMADLRKRVIEDAAPLASVARVFKDTFFPTSEADRHELERQGLKRAASRLKDLLSTTGVAPKRVVAGVTESLERLIEALDQAARAA